MSEQRAYHIARDSVCDHRVLSDSGNETALYIIPELQQGQNGCGQHRHATGGEEIGKVAVILGDSAVNRVEGDAGKEQGEACYAGCPVYVALPACEDDEGCRQYGRGNEVDQNSPQVKAP